MKRSALFFYYLNAGLPRSSRAIALFMSSCRKALHYTNGTTSLFRLSMVEVRGVEPRSDRQTQPLSTCLVSVYKSRLKGH